MLTGPPLNRTPMAPVAWPPPRGLLVRDAAAAPWQRAGMVRRLALASRRSSRAMGFWVLLRGDHQ